MELVERAHKLLAQWNCELFQVRPSREVTREQIEQWLNDYTAMIQASKGEG